MRTGGGRQFVGVALAMIAFGTTAQYSAPPAKGDAAARNRLGVEVLKGAWVRPDGGYTIAIKSVGPNGQLDAMYFNPNPLPFEKAQAVQDGATLRVSFVLRAGGYDGSTYELTYDPASDRLQGTYYQAVVKQKFSVQFSRK